MPGSAGLSGPVRIETLTLTAKMDKQLIKYALRLQQRSLAAIETLFAEGRINAAAAVAMMQLAVDMERRAVHLRQCNPVGATLVVALGAKLPILLWEYW